MTGFAPVNAATATGKTAAPGCGRAEGPRPDAEHDQGDGQQPGPPQGYLALNGGLSSGVLPAPVHELLAVTTAEYNGCEYCLSAHTYIGANTAKIDATDLEAARDAKASDPRTQALLTLSDTIARDHGQVDDAAPQAARGAGATDDEIGEVVGHLALNVLTNYFNILAEVDNDRPVVTPRIAA